METVREMLYSGVNPSGYSRIPHLIYLDDFSTNYPSQNRINRIANEINEYLEYKRKYTEV